MEHKIPIGSLVEHTSGIRLLVAEYIIGENNTTLYLLSANLSFSGDYSSSDIYNEQSLRVIHCRPQWPQVKPKESNQPPKQLDHRSIANSLLLNLLALLTLTKPNKYGFFNAFKPRKVEHLHLLISVYLAIQDTKDLYRELSGENYGYTQAVCRTVKWNAIQKRYYRRRRATSKRRWNRYRFSR
ncbi:MAG: hypothetical protein GY928_33900 [Colwellia sp.]|nr:hypothetical protein [Colwellia sp.]